MFMLTLATLDKKSHFSTGSVFQKDLKTSVPGIFQGDLFRAVFATSYIVYSCFISFVLGSHMYTYISNYI